MGSCLSLRFCPARYLQHQQERLHQRHQENTFSHYSLAGSRQGSRVSCVELYPAFAFDDNSSLNLSEFDLDEAGRVPCGNNSCSSSCGGGLANANSSTHVNPSTSSNGGGGILGTPFCDRWSHIVLEESELGPLPNYSTQQQQQQQQQQQHPATANAPGPTLAAGWSLSSSPQLDRAAVGRPSFGYEQFTGEASSSRRADQEHERVQRGEVMATSVSAQGEGKSKRVDIKEEEEDNPSPPRIGFWKSIQRRLDVWRVFASSSSFRGGVRSGDVDDGSAALS